MLTAEQKRIKRHIPNSSWHVLQQQKNMFFLRRYVADET